MSGLSPALLPPAMPPQLSPEPSSQPPAAPEAAPAAAIRAGSVPVPAGEVFAIAAEYVEAGRLDAAERLLGHILAVAPRQTDAVHLKGLIAFRRGNTAEAAALMERSIAEGGIKSAHFRNLSELYRLQVRLDEALTAARRAVALDPADPLGPFNLAMIHYDRLEISACIAAARHAVDLRPNLPQAHMKLGQAHLLIGEFAKGWEEYEWRYQIPGAQPLMPPNFAARANAPQWNGQDLGDGILLLIADQGFGDVVMFTRYIPWVLERCAHVAIACSAEMLPILRRHFPAVPMFNRWDECPPYAAFCPFSGLPRLHGTRLDSIPAKIPYLFADPPRSALWRERLDALVPAGLRRIGIAWAGRPTHNNDINRTITLDTLAPLAEVPGIALVSLQKGPATAQIAAYKGAAPLIDLDRQIADFDDTMAVIENIDLVVCVDTSVGHFAGAMGRPAWVMVPQAPDWRWLLGREDSPWYPSLRLLRHRAPRRWDLLVPDVAAELRRFVAGVQQ
ncbi:MAG: tetratricopeptide repeat protein [Rhodospirillales bacterium]|nr:tetratricopeptide repeat protein [Rhodospirillales bacterium]MDE2575656.1 tetratricopeptide repeat protein [Rhodospirillales bacterium]